LLYERLKLAKEVRADMLVGISPDSSLCDKSRDSDAVRLPIFLGILPLKWFQETFKLFKAIRALMP
jgi:hypothetical protein